MLGRLTWKPWEGLLCTRHLPPTLTPPRFARPRHSFPRWFAAGKAGRLASPSASASRPASPALRAASPTRPSHRLVLPTLLLAISGCVVPIGPEWTDPERNQPPTISYAIPAIGSVLDFGAGGNVAMGLEVALADQNTQDNLYVRWIIDYPPYLEGASHVALPQTLPGGEQIQRQPIRFAPNCSDVTIAHDSSNHRLLLAVSDRPFSDDPQNPQVLDPVSDGNYRVEASWDFTLACP